MEPGAPVPRTREAAVDARPSVKEVVGAASVERFPKEIDQDVLLERVGAAKRCLDVALELGRLGHECVDLVQRANDGTEDVADLRILVDKHERVRDVLVPKVDDRAPDPVVELALRRVQNDVHGARDERRWLDAMKTLARVCELVRRRTRQQVFIRETPQPKHVVRDLAPQREALEDVVELSRVRVGEAGAVVSRHNRERVLGVGAGRVVGWGKVLVQHPNHAVDGVPLKVQVVVVVRDRVQTLLDIVGAESGRHELIRDLADRDVLLLDLFLDLGAGFALRGHHHRRAFDQRVVQKRQRIMRLQKRVHSLERLDWTEPEEVLDGRGHGVLEKVHEDAVLAAHLLGVHDLVPPSELEELAKEPCKRVKLLLFEQGLPGGVVHRYDEPGEEAGNFLQLHASPLGRRGRCGDSRVNLVRVVAHIESGFQRPQALTFFVRQAKGDVLGAVAHGRRRGRCIG
ncbi:hypothetical protein H310_08917 [Aphanomyces invadans]|uniref:Uncharacterized protein n=1 Tax=Aphanomyces invadans TaxID=157072 RepID=A0A024TW22_9STRA|nr:hypothetical protein H310_08917 [Aphanomyces invadans]ETV98189.1 hypothetical protein H310_08917 [Aphanomyces invadans]|eukprot:XP_008873064.1 hypothetical protein H310_08917 [Aphanomyces invadans]